MSPEAIAELLEERMALQVDAELAQSLAAYLDLLVRWNARTNLTAIREPKEIVLRHFGESIQCARALPLAAQSLLDFGSGAGFPGAVCALMRPDLSVVLAESQGKKSAFLSELVRLLGLKTTVHAGRVESLPTARGFDAVTLRAVDRMEQACAIARKYLSLDGLLCLLTTGEAVVSVEGVEWAAPVPIRGSERRVILFGRASV